MTTVHPARRVLSTGFDHIHLRRFFYLIPMPHDHRFTFFPTTIILFCLWIISLSTLPATASTFLLPFLDLHKNTAISRFNFTFIQTWMTGTAQQQRNRHFSSPLLLLLLLLIVFNQTLIRRPIYAQIHWLLTHSNYDGLSTRYSFPFQFFVIQEIFQGVLWIVHEKLLSSRHSLYGIAHILPNSSAFFTLTSLPTPRESLLFIEAGWRGRWVPSVELLLNWNFVFFFFIIVFCDCQPSGR